ncbi:unnamed protein product [Lota lota]
MGWCPPSKVDLMEEVEVMDVVEEEEVVVEEEESEEELVVEEEEVYNPQSRRTGYQKEALINGARLAVQDTSTPGLSQRLGSTGNRTRGHSVDAAGPQRTERYQLTTAPSLC